MPKYHISVVSPVYKAPKILPELVSRLEKSLAEITDSYEIILVDDGCPQGSWDVVVELSKKYDTIKGIKLSRNFGQHNAITAGLHYATGEWVIVMDCDLQDRPEEIPNLYKKANEGFDIVLARRISRQDNLIKRWCSILFYRAFSYMTDTHQDPTISNYGIYRKNVIQSILSMGDYIRVFPILIQWVGFNRTSLDVQHDSRFNGKSSYTIFSLLRLAINMIISFSEKPLRIGLRFGIFIVFSSFLFGLCNLFLYLNGSILVPGYASIIVSIWFLAGIIIAFLGLTGLYIGKIFEKVKGRPYFIVSKMENIS